MSSDSNNKIIRRPAERDVTQYASIEKQTSPDKILIDAIKIFGSQIEKFKLKATQGYLLDKEEIKQVESCVSGVLRIKKDERDELAQGELQKQLQQMSEAELLQHMDKLSKGRSNE
jgi:hypothetical protein